MVTFAWVHQVKDASRTLVSMIEIASFSSTSQLHKCIHNLTLFYHIFTLSKPLESSQTCISMTSLCPQHASIRLWNMLKSCKIIAGLKLCAFPGSVKNVVTGTITLPQSLFAVEFEDAIFCFFLLSLSFSPAWITLNMAIKKYLLLLWRDYFILLS